MLLPTTFLFHYQITVGRRSDLPKSKGKLLDLSDESRLPWLICQPEKTPFADVRLAWNDNGLALQVEVSSRSVPLNHPGLGQKNQPAISLWFDTRPSPDSHRAGRFCSHWSIRPGQKGGASRPPLIEAVAIARAREESTLPSADDVLINDQPLENGYKLEAWFPRESLPGYDPEVSPHMGFFYQIEEPEFGVQMPWEAGGFPVDSDPSLWLTLLLEE